MQLLVSVSDGIEAGHALDGGADLIDAKNPSSGALGAVTLSVLQQIHRVVAGRRVITAALGDADDEEEVERAVLGHAAVGIGFVKIGFAGITSIERVERLLAGAVRGASARKEAPCGVVAVAYADTAGATSVNHVALVDAAARAGASGVLLDTALKHRPGLFELVPQGALESWVALAHAARLTVALAGKLSAGDLSRVRDTGADIAGVRGAACEGGREGRIVASRVRALGSRLRRAAVG